jgi:CHAT domain-containing protein
MPIGLILISCLFFMLPDASASGNKAMAIDKIEAEVLHVLRNGSKQINPTEFFTLSAQLDSLFKQQMIARDKQRASQVLYYKALLYFHHDSSNSTIDLLRKGLQIPNLETKQRGKLHLALAKVYAARGNLSSALIHSRLAVQSYQDISLGQAPWTEARLFTASLQISLQQLADANNILRQIKQDSPALSLQKGRWFAENMAPEASIRQFHSVLIQLVPGFADSNFLSLPEADQLTPKPEILTALMGKAAGFEQLYYQTKRTIYLKHAIHHYRLAYHSMAVLAKKPDFRDFIPQRPEALLKALNQSFLRVARQLNTPEDILFPLSIGKQIALQWDCPTCQIPADSSRLLTRLQQRLNKNNSVLLDYTLGTDSLFITVVHAEGIHLTGFAAPEQTPKKILDFLQRIAQRQFTAEKDPLVAEKSQSWYRILIKPIAHLLPDTGHLIIHADYPINLMPFDALRSNNTYLLERYTISYCPNVQDYLHTQHKHKKKYPNIISRFSTDAGKSTMSVLPYDQTIIGHEARIDRLKSLAEHARFIQLSLNADAMLTVYDTIGKHQQALTAAAFSKLNLPLQGIMLYYSQSDVRFDTWTGTLLNQGVSTVIRVRWSPKPAIMEEFNRLLRDGKPVSTAIREAKLNWLRNSPDTYQHPYYWAGIELHGHDDQLKRTNWILWVGILLAVLMISWVIRRAGRT